MERQESDPNIMPEVKAVRCPPSMEGIARAIAKVLRPIPDLGITHGDHLPTSLRDKE